MQDDAISRPTVVKFEGTNMACMGGDEIMKEFENNTQQNDDDAISRKSIKHKLQEHHDFFVNAYGGYSNLPQNDKSRVDEITNCIAMVVNEPSVKPQEKTGKWIERESGTEDKEYGFETVIVCSHCDFPATTFYSEDCESRTQIRTDFCPNCGARMVKNGGK